MKNTWVLLAGAIAVVAFLFFLSMHGRKPPLIPRNAAHEGMTTQESCSACHAPGKSSPLRAGHPPKEQCLVCHK